MKIQNMILLLSLLVLMALVSNCAQSAKNVLTPSSTVSTLPTGSTTPTLTPADIDTPNSPPTSTAAPILAVDDARTRLLDLLANNGGCDLPCLWGVTPGKSIYQQAQEILEPLTSISQLTGFRPGLGSISLVYTEEDLMLIIDAGYLANNQIVSHIAFQAREMKKVIASNGEPSIESVFDSASFGERIDYYSLPNVLSEQGMPTSVMLSAHGVPVPRGGSGGFDILLLYPDKGVLINYTTQGNLVGSNMRGCPVSAHVEMELYPPGQSDSFFESLKKTDWAVKMNYYKPLEEVTSMKLEEFYQTFREPTEKCIETPAKLWPTPQP